MKHYVILSTPKHGQPAAYTVYAMHAANTASSCSRNEFEHSNATHNFAYTQRTRVSVERKKDETAVPSEWLRFLSAGGSPSVLGCWLGLSTVEVATHVWLD